MQRSDPFASESLPSLVFTSDEMPGYSRVRRGRGFSYRLPDGALLRSGGNGNGSPLSQSRRHMNRSGSAVSPTGISRPRDSMPGGGNNMSITRPGGSWPRIGSSPSFLRSRPVCRGSAQPIGGHSGRIISAASVSSPGSSCCSTSPAIASGIHVTRRRIAATGSRLCMRGMCGSIAKDVGSLFAASQGWRTIRRSRTRHS